MDFHRYCFPKNLNYKQSLISHAADAFSFIYLSSTPFPANMIKFFHLSVYPPVFLWSNHTTYLFHPSGWGNGFFPPTYTTCPLDIFQKVSCVTGIWSPSFNTQSKSQQILYVSLFMPFQALPDHHLLDWCLHFPTSPPTPFTLKPSKWYKGNPLPQITHFPWVPPVVQSLISFPALLPSRGTNWPTSSLV